MLSFFFIKSISSRYIAIWWWISLFVEMYPLITFSYKGYLLGEPILDKQQFYEYVLQGNIFIYHVHVRSKHLKSQCLLYWKYSKLLCIRTLIKLSHHTSSVEAVHSQVIFSFMIIFNCSFLSHLTFILPFSFVFVLVLKNNVEDKVNKVVVKAI